MAVYSDYIAAAIMYNLQILPESILCGLIILAIVLANPAVVTVAAGVGGTQLLTGAVSRLIMQFAPANAVVTTSMDTCSSGYIGRSWNRLMRGTPDLLWHPYAPSVYQATVGFLAGWGWGSQQLYKDEISAGAMNGSMMLGFAILAAILVLVAIIFRTSTGCETLLGAVAGAAFGIALGYFGSIMVGYLTNRRLTNIWGIPLLRDRINNGSPLYVCPE
jgi:hypothetical protein